MKRLLGIAIGSIFLFSAAGAYAGPGACFNGGAPANCSPSNCTGPAVGVSCDADDSGCVSDTKNHMKCSATIGGLFCKLVSCVLNCHKKQADARFKGATQDAADAAEDTCEIGGAKSCKGKLDAAIAKLTSAAICDPQQLTNAASEEAVLVGHPSPIPTLSLDGQNSLAYCDSTGGAQFIEDTDCEGGTNNGNECTADTDCPGGGKCLREDTGWVPKDKGSLACEDALTKANAALVCCTIKCHTAMNSKFFAGKAYNEEACEESSNPAGKGCHDKFNKVRDKTIAKGLCTAACNNAAGWNANAANSIGTVDGANVIAFPCL